MKDEALKLALEALEEHGEAPKDWACKECVPFSDILKDGFQCKYHEAMTAIKQALAQPAVPLTDEQIEAIWYDHHDREMGYAMRFARAIEAAHGITEKGQQ